MTYSWDFIWSWVVLDLTGSMNIVGTWFFSNHPRYGRVYNCKYSQILGCHNNWILIQFSDDGTDEEYYKNINQNIIDGNVMNMSLIIMERKYGAIDADYYSYHGYYITKFYLSPYTLQADLSINGKVISSVEMVCEENYCFPINVNYHYYVLQKPNPLTQLFC